METELEIWKEIKGNKNYLVSNKGNVISLNYNWSNKPKKLKINKMNNGYTWVNIAGKVKNIHRLVAEAFLPNPNMLPCVNHKNSIRDDNRVENLEWCTYSYNTKYSYIYNNKNRNRDYLKVGVIQYDKNGNFLNKYDSVSEAAKKINISRKGIIGCCLHKEHYNTAGGYKWEYQL